MIVTTRDKNTIDIQLKDFLFIEKSFFLLNVFIFIEKSFLSKFKVQRAHLSARIGSPTPEKYEAREKK